MSASNYCEAMKYELFIRKVYNYHSYNRRNGAHLCFMQNAMDAEQGDSYSLKHIGSFEKQFDKVKGYISKALIKLSKTPKYKKDRELFMYLNKCLDYCFSTDDLMKIVEKAKNAIIRD